MADGTQARLTTLTTAVYAGAHYRVVPHGKDNTPLVDVPRIGLFLLSAFCEEARRRGLVYNYVEQVPGYGWVTITNPGTKHCPHCGGAL